MMKRAQLALIVILFLSVPAVAAPAGTYSDLVAKAEQGEPIDVQVLRDAYVHLPQYDPYTMTRPPFLAILQALRAHKLAQACPAIEALLKTDYIDTFLHLMRAACMQRSHAGLQDFFVKLAIVPKLNAAVLGTGDGKSMGTAYRIVSFSELGAVSGRNHVKFDGIAEIAGHGHHYLLLEGPIAQAPVRPSPHPIPGANNPPAPPTRWVKIFFNVDTFGLSKAPPPKNLFDGKFG
jgi:hypothetical protein